MASSELDVTALTTLAHVGATSSDKEHFWTKALPVIRTVADATFARATLTRQGTVTVLGEDGPESQGATVEHRLPDLDSTTISLVGTERSADDLELLWTIVDLAWGRLTAHDELVDLQRRVDGAQKLANMGDYDWHIASDTNTWSDQLYRIYGYEPQAFNASYEKFLSMIHPDDRETIQGIHQQAYATGEPYEMIERIVRPTGEIRYLSSNGEVVMDDNGNPVRMRGTCVDITDRVRAEQVQARRRQALEINDNVVQGLSAAVMAIDTNDHEFTAMLVKRTLESAKELVNDWLDPGFDEGIEPGDLVRSAHASIHRSPSAERGQ